MKTSEWKVLAVDDEPDNLGLISDLLAFYDVTVVSGASGKEAIDLLESQPFTMALIDIQMPYVSGWDVIQHVRNSSKPTVRDMLVIGVTAYAMRGDRERVIEAGFDGYISKPIDIDTFMHTLQEIATAYETRTGRQINVASVNNKTETSSE